MDSDFISRICIQITNTIIIFLVKITSCEKTVATVLKALYNLGQLSNSSESGFKDKSFPIYSITEQLLFLSTYFSTR